MFDASGRVGSGFIWGNNYWLGSKKACDLANAPVRVVLSTDLPKNNFVNLSTIETPFPVEYKLAWAKHQSKWQIDLNTYEKVSFGQAIKRFGLAGKFLPSAKQKMLC